MRKAKSISFPLISLVCHQFGAGSVNLFDFSACEFQWNM